VSLWNCFWRNCFWPLTLLILLGLAQMFWPGGEWRKIESDVSATVTSKLKENDIEWAQVDTKNRGRDVLLSGSAPSEEAKSTAIRIAEELSQDKRGNPVARIVEWQGNVAEPVAVVPEPAPEPITPEPTPVAPEPVVELQNVTDLLTVGENILPIPKIGSLVSEFGLPEGTLRVSLNKGLKITGEVASDERKTAIGDNLENTLG